MPAREIQEIKWIAALSEHGADFGGNRKKQSLSVGAASCEYAYCDGVNGNPGLGAPQGIAQERKGKVGCITSNPVIFSPLFFPVCRSRLQQTPRHRFAFLGSPAPVKAYLPWRSLHRIVQHDSARHIECLVPLRNVHCIVPLCLEETKEFASELLVAVYMYTWFCFMKVL